MSEWHPAFEEYCEAIFELDEDDIRVVQARIAQRLNVSRPSVSEMVRRMEGADLLTVTHGVVRLSPSGQALAERVVRRHRLAERFLTDILGLSWSVAHHEAGKWEHVISAPVEEALFRLLEDPTTCPHGNPIPGSDYRTPDLRPLSGVDRGEAVRIHRIPEALEFEPGVLEFLEGARLVPGAAVVLVGRTPEGVTTVEVEGRTVDLEAFAADRILVGA